MSDARLANVIERMKADHCDQLLVCDPMAMAYLTGYENEPYERLSLLLINADGHCHMFLNKLFPPFEDPKITVTWLSDTDDGTALVASYLHSGDRIGVDQTMCARFLLPLMAAVKADYHLTSLVDDLRMIKDQEEQALMIKASAINDEAMQEVKKLLAQGLSEQEIADALLDIYTSRGASQFSFTPIIAYGQHGADPHHTTSASLPQPGDTIICDIGCVYQGYCSDMTRTFFYQEAQSRDVKVYEIVQKAQEAAVAAVRPGVPLKDIDRIAREIITDAGYGEAFTHRLGHFIGRGEHEYGDVSSSSEIIAAPGMIFSIEPGIYLKDRMGVRIEDLVMVTNEGCVRLNHFSRDLQIVCDEVIE